MRQHQPSRRAVLQQGLLLGVGGWAAALPAAPHQTIHRPRQPDHHTDRTGGTATTANRILLAYFSRPGRTTTTAAGGTWRSATPKSSPA